MLPVHMCIYLLSSQKTMNSLRGGGVVFVEPKTSTLWAIPASTVRGSNTGLPKERTPMSIYKG